MRILARSGTRYLLAIDDTTAQIVDTAKDRIYAPVRADAALKLVRWEEQGGDLPDISTPEIKLWLKHLAGQHDQSSHGKGESTETHDVARTSVKQVPELLRKAPLKPGTINLDLGGGKYDLGTKLLADRGVENLVLDPFARSKEHNDAILVRLRSNKADTATLANVLNVISDLKRRQSVIRQAKDLVRPGGSVYISVYEGSRSGTPAATSVNTWQENRKLSTYLGEVKKVFPEAKIQKGYIVADVSDTLATKHLQGQHDQHTHGKGGGIRVDTNITSISLEELASWDGGRALYAQAALTRLNSGPVWHGDRDGLVVPEGFVLSRDGEIKGIVSLFALKDRLEVDRLATKESGYGVLMMKQVARIAEERNLPVILAADDSAVGFYVAIGMSHKEDSSLFHWTVQDAKKFART